MSVGSAVGAILTGVLLGALDWRTLFVLYAVAGVAWAVWFGLWFRDEPGEHRSVNAAELALIGGTPPATGAVAKGKQARPTPWLALFASPALWWICGQQFFRAAGYVFYASWFPTFLEETYGVTTEEAGWLTSMPFWGIVVGSLVGGAASDGLLARTGSRRLSRQGLAIFSMASGAALVLLAMAQTNVVSAVALFSASSLCAALASACAYVITIDMGGAYVAPVFSTMNMSGNVGAMILPALVPYLVQKETRDWSPVLWLLAGIYLAAGVCWALLNPNGTIGERSDKAAPESSVSAG
jgi:nitrate/nitrite transporter NarK